MEFQLDNLESQSSSFDQDLFPNQNLIKDYICPICTNVPNPDNCFEVVCCGHLFCEDCLKEWLKNDQTCPLCKTSMREKDKTYRDIKDKNKMIYRQIKAIEMLCPFDCPWLGTIEDVKEHLKVCKNLPKPCKYQKIGCKFVGNAEAVSEHEKTNCEIHLGMAMKIIEENNLIEKKNKDKNNLLFVRGNKAKFSKHQHILRYTKGRYNPWICDETKSSSSNCPGNDNNPYRFHCAKCKYDLCETCAKKFFVSQ